MVCADTHQDTKFGFEPHNPDPGMDLGFQHGQARALGTMGGSPDGTQYRVFFMPKIVHVLCFSIVI